MTTGDLAAALIERAPEPRVRRPRLLVGLGLVVAVAGGILAFVAAGWVRDRGRPGQGTGLAAGIVVYAPLAEAPEPKQPPEAGSDEPPADMAASGAPSPEPALPPAGPGAPPEPPPALRPQNIEAMRTDLTPELRARVLEALGGLVAGEPLPMRMVAVGESWPPSILSPGFLFAVVPDAEADARLDPLVPGADRGAAAYVGSLLRPAEIWSDYDWPPEARKARIARLPDAARALDSVVVIRASAAGDFGFRPASDAPNFLFVSLARPGDVEEALRAVIRQFAPEGVGAAPVDLAVAGDDPARWMGAGGLALMLGGTSAFVLGLIAGRARTPAPAGRVGAAVWRGARVVAGRPGAYLAIAFGLAAIVAGFAVWGGPPGAGDLVRFYASREFEGLTGFGLVWARPGAGYLVSLFVLGVVVTVMLRLLVGIGIPSLVPGLGLVAAAAQMALWGVVLAPATLMLLARLPLRGAVAGIELAGYALAALGAWRVLAATTRPSAAGGKTRRQGWALGAMELYMLLPLALAILIAACALEALLVAWIGWSG